MAACLAIGACGGDDDDASSEAADTQTISFQEPEDPGEDPFTPPADVEGDETVEVQQPFGGSGSNRVCDRDKLIEFLEANPERMAEWARVLGIEPQISAVKKYIAKLHPVTLTRDTQVTNHAFTNGQAVPFQAILQAGTAVLVDEYGVPVVRCYCGNPLGPAVFTPEAEVHRLPARLPAAQAVQVRARAELRQDLLPQDVLPERRLRRGVHLAAAVRSVQGLLQGVSGSAGGDRGEHLRTAARTRACAPARTRARAGAGPPSPRASSATRRARSSRPSSAPSWRATRPSPRRPAAAPAAPDRHLQRRPRQRGRAGPGRRRRPELPVGESSLPGSGFSLTPDAQRPPRRRPGAT